MSEKTPHPTDPHRWADGTARPGNGLAVTHGGRRRVNAVAARQSELFHRWAADLGGVDRLTAGQEAILVRAVEADMLATTAAQYLRRSRETITSARAQKAIAVLLQATDRVFRGAAILGTERKTKPAASIGDYLAGRVEPERPA